MKSPGLSIGVVVFYCSCCLLQQLFFALFVLFRVLRVEPLQN